MEKKTRPSATQTILICRACTILAVLLAMICVPLAVAEEAHEKEGHRFHRHHVALTVGNTQTDGSENGLTVGVDYGYRFNRWLGLGGIAEYTGGDFKHLLFLAGASLHPYKNWVLVAAGGTEVHKDHDDHEENNLERDWVIRTGVNYQFPVSDRWTIAPEVNIDFSEQETLFVYGIAVGFGL